MPEPTVHEGRIIAFSHVYQGNAVTATKLYFDDGVVLLLDGHLDIPVIVTMRVHYTEKTNKPATLNALELLAGG